MRAASALPNFEAFHELNYLDSVTRGINLAPEENDTFEELQRQAARMMVPEGYPVTIGRLVTLRNGETLRIRPIRPDDEPRLATLYDRLSRHTAYQRFFTVMRRLPSDWGHYFANVDYRRRLAVVVERETVAGIELVGVGRYEPTEEETLGEVAFLLEDGYQGQGLGPLLLDEVLRAGTERGLTRFRADVLGENHRMLRLLAHRTRILERTVDQGVVCVIFEPR
jgi:RimJ/RimL family protein N-acetyltransferase